MQRLPIATAPPPPAASVVSPAAAAAAVVGDGRITVLLGRGCDSVGKAAMGGRSSANMHGAVVADTTKPVAAAVECNAVYHRLLLVTESASILERQHGRTSVDPRRSSLRNFAVATSNTRINLPYIHTPQRQINSIMKKENVNELWQRFIAATERTFMLATATSVPS